ncbi:MAG TPA: SusE domain-containing protein [Mucilaginibacter sp.]|nr:SusE domain-containing protein [Mucilaginibacter sp.]
MKKICLLSLLVLFCALALNSCKKDVKTLDTNVQPVTVINAPSNDTSITIAPTTGASVVFKWAPTESQDLVLYEVVFDKADGNFSNPVYKVVSDGSGVQAKATISQKTLNTIANAAGIAALASGTLKWAVVASKVTNNKVSTVSHTLEVTRPAGFATVPNALYLTGSATEQGADMSKAIPFKKISDGVFELYTSLQAGTYKLVDNTSGSATAYSINGPSIVLNGETTVSGDKNVYRISLDFNNAAATLTQIESVNMFLAIDNKIWFTLPYAGNSQWELDGANVVIPQESWGDESRYKYEFFVKDAAGNESAEWFGSANQDNPDPSLTTPLSYFYVYPVSSSQFDNCFKIVPSYSGKNCNINVNFSPTITQYTNSITPQ